MKPFEITFHESIEAIGQSCWDGLFGQQHPFTRFAFLHAMESSGAVGGDSGWLPRHLLLRVEGEAVAAMPLYLKLHSYGEFVFDWNWAEAWQSHGLNYYPKLVSAIPFTPVTGARLAVADGHDNPATLAVVAGALVQACAEWNCSGWHLLFDDAGLASKLSSAFPEPLLRREDVRFLWRNRDYVGFDDYLANMRASRRKKIRRERRALDTSGIQIQRLTGAEIGASEWAFFQRCYQRTNQQRSGHSGYLGAAFFRQLLTHQRDQMLLVMASQECQAIASALFLFDGERLYGRYWGALEERPFLHFEVCFYQGIEFCLERGLQQFDPGTHGEHKLLRGFEPCLTHSRHWIVQPDFRRAIAQFLKQERKSVRAYQRSSRNMLPFHRGQSGECDQQQVLRDKAQ